jgi:cobyrinic acid a,c-diamide synthase
MLTQLPRVMIAGLSGDAGKSLVAIGLIGALRRRGLRVAPFKKGPDFIDAAWLGQAAGVPGRNLDTFLMSSDAIHGSLGRSASAADCAVIEGNRGLFDGADEHGTHSSAELAKLVRTPVVLVVDATKATRTLAALVLGCRTMDPEVVIAGVILNRVGTGRHQAVARAAIASVTGVPVLGAIPRLRTADLPCRHLGLLTPVEHHDPAAAIAAATDAVERFVDLEAVLSAARQVPELELRPATAVAAVGRARVGVLQDQAFSFYYPENLEALEAAGAELVYASPLHDASLPDVDALYAGGGFPEEAARQLSANQSFRDNLGQRIADGLPVWAECGGLMYLAQGIVRDGVSYPMVGALPIAVEHSERPQGHGYVSGRVDGDNPFFETGHAFAGHEFHYSSARQVASRLDTVVALDRGVGLGAGRDGIHAQNVVATYTHVHALGAPEWAPAIVRSATRHKYEHLV